MDAYKRFRSRKISDFISNHEKLIVKPIGLSSGRGIHILDENDTPAMLNSCELLLESFIQQHPEMNRINSSSVNTIKTEAGIDVLSATLRVGGVGAVVDNYHSGGVGYPLDIQYGFVCNQGTDLTGLGIVFIQERV